MDEPEEIGEMDHSTESDELVRQHELDGLRIRQVARARQAATRAASYCVVAMLACAVMAVDLAWRAVRRYARLHEVVRPTIYLLAAVALASAIPWLWKRAAAFRLEATRKALPEPANPPDFSTLSDGSHIVANLERLGRNDTP